MGAEASTEEAPVAVADASVTRDADDSTVGNLLGGIWGSGAAQDGGSQRGSHRGSHRGSRHSSETPEHPLAQLGFAVASHDDRASDCSQSISNFSEKSQILETTVRKDGKPMPKRRALPLWEDDIEEPAFDTGGADAKRERTEDDFAPGSSAQVGNVDYDNFSEIQSAGSDSVDGSQPECLPAFEEGAFVVDELNAAAEDDSGAKSRGAGTQAGSIPVHMHSNWYRDRGKFEPSGTGASFTPGWTEDSAMCLCKDPELEFADVDLQADIKIKDGGDMIGVVIRAVNFSRYTVLTLNAAESRAEYWYNSPLKTSVEPNDFGEGGFQFYRFTPLRARGTIKSRETIVHIARLGFRCQGTRLRLNNCLISQPGGKWLENHDPTKLIDDNMLTKWACDLRHPDTPLPAKQSGQKDGQPLKLDVHSATLLLEFEKPIRIDEFRFMTADGNSLNHDPCRWTFAGSHDGVRWMPLHWMISDYEAPTARSAQTEWFSLRHASWDVRRLHRNMWHRIRFWAIGHARGISLDGEQIALFGESEDTSGFIGFQAFGKSTIQVRNVFVTNRAARARVEAEGEEQFVQELQRIDDAERQARAWKMRLAWASNFIQDMGRLKLTHVKQRMQPYIVADKTGYATKVRAEKVLSWVVLLSVLEKFYTAIKADDMLEEKERRYLLTLPSPPPPPPAQAAPTNKDEELHYNYEAMKAEYEPRWNAAGRKVFGRETWDGMRMKDHGPAEKEKGLISKKCLEMSMTAMSEHDHQEYIRKAWALEHDWLSIDDVSEDQIAKWAKERAQKHKEAILAASPAAASSNPAPGR
eukprot:TRINITY_DN8657_c0_g1_i1.p1 TRINITY_DN8657_c0_g1~~TRINITY_DN8657_c0_g1_i1.p1  ORF type:complete len:809 (-),score=135.06 TRINITY_DN8657_c0_g1_i1:62-2488(-)